MNIVAVLLLVLCFDSSAWAFPDTIILDNFNRADESPLAGGWGGIIFSSTDPPDIVSNQLTNTGPTYNVQTYYYNTNYGPGVVEAYMTMVDCVIPGTCDFLLWMHGKEEGSSSTLDGYLLYINTSGVWHVERQDNGVPTQIGTDFGTQALADGDSVGLKADGSGNFTAWYKAAAGSWTQIGASKGPDTTYTSGHIGYGTNLQNTIEDDFGGGLVASGGATRRRNF